MSVKSERLLRELCSFRSVQTAAASLRGLNEPTPGVSLSLPVSSEYNGSLHRRRRRRGGGELLSGEKPVCCLQRRKRRRSSSEGQSSSPVCKDQRPVSVHANCAALSVPETRLLSHQTPVSHRGRRHPIGRPAAWSGCGRGRTPADGQSESAADATGKGASNIPQRLGPSRSDTL